MKGNFKFSLGQGVRLKSSSEEGQVLARAEYLRAENSYLVHYQASDGRAVEAWWGESVLEDAYPALDGTSGRDKAAA